MKSSRSTLKWKENLPQINKFFSVSFVSTSPAIRMPKWVMCDNNLTMKFPAGFHNYTGLNGPVNSFIWFTIAPSNELILGCKPYWSVKRKKTTSCEKWLPGGVLQNSFPKNLSKFTEKYLCEFLSNTVKSFHAVRLATFFKERPPHWVFRVNRL